MKKLSFTLLLTFVAIFVSAQEKQDTSYWKKGGMASITFSQTSLTNWSGGGDNAVSTNALLDVFANFNKGKNSWENIMKLEYGLVKQGDEGVRKSIDKIDFTSKYGYKNGGRWFYTALFDFKTQFAKGYNYSSTDGVDDVKVSNFLAPAYMTLSVGMDYKPNDIFSAYVSPLTSKMTIVNDDDLSDAGAFGVDAGDKFRCEFGAFTKLAVNKDIMKNVNFKSTLDLFSNYSENFGNVDVFLEKAVELGADYVATGHYCQKETIVKDGKEIHRLIAGEDNNKDQSYFLCQLSQKQLSKAMFPIGHIIKPEVREIARREKMASAEKKDSQGICFVGKVDLPVFLQQKLKAMKGKIIEIMPEKADEIIPKSDSLEAVSLPYEFKPEHGTVVGEHNGAHFFTVGQRKGLNVGGKKEPLFVIGTDVVKNIVYVGMGHGHPLLTRKALFIPEEEIHWIREDLMPTEECERRYDIRIRYRQPLQKGTIHFKNEGLYILFDEPQRAVVSGQFAAWYDEGELIGSGVID